MASLHASERLQEGLCQGHLFWGRGENRLGVPWRRQPAKCDRAIGGQWDGGYEDIMPHAVQAARRVKGAIYLFIFRD